MVPERQLLRLQEVLGHRMCPREGFRVYDLAVQAVRVCMRRVRSAPRRQAARTSALVLRLQHASLIGWPARSYGQQPQEHHAPSAALSGLKDATVT